MDLKSAWNSMFLTPFSKQIFGGPTIPKFFEKTEDPY
jgi:hypothetical protein